jgi:hypothetical protein
MSRLIMDLVDKWQKNLGIADPKVIAELRADLQNLIDNESMLDSTRQGARMQRYWGKQAETFAEFWAKCFCPECETVNWVYQSHSQRAMGTGVDPDGYECRKCKHKVVWDESILNGWENLESAMLEEGREEPK